MLPPNAPNLIEVIRALWQPWWVYVISFAVVVVLTPLLRSLAIRWEFYDRPEGLLKQPHARPTPYLGGLAIFVALVTLPIWYTLAFGGSAAAPELEMPEGETQCVEEKAYMLAHHMDLLDEWRDAVVRDGVCEPYVSKAYGTEHEMSLTKTCMGCHTDRQTFCYKCHDYANVKLLEPLGTSEGAQASQGGIRCWDCHEDKKED